MVEVRQIAAAQVDGDYTRILAAGGKVVMIKSTLSSWERKLPSSLFHKISLGSVPASQHFARFAGGGGQGGVSPIRSASMRAERRYKPFNSFTISSLPTYRCDSHIP